MKKSFKISLILVIVSWIFLIVAYFNKDWRTTVFYIDRVMVFSAIIIFLVGLFKIGIEFPVEKYWVSVEELKERIRLFKEGYDEMQESKRRLIKDLELFKQFRINKTKTIKYNGSTSSTKNN